MSERTDSSRKHPAAATPSYTDRLGAARVARLLGLLEESGNWSGVRSVLEAEKVALLSSAPEFDVFARLLEVRLRAAMEIESRDGRGSLLRRDHPSVLRALGWCAEQAQRAGDVQPLRTAA